MNKNTQDIRESHKSDIENLIYSLEVEIRDTAKGYEKTENLRRLKEVAQIYKGEDKLTSFAEIAEKIKNTPEEPKIFSGWTKFDDIISGFRPQQLVVVSAIMKSGKTSFLMDLTCRLKAYNPLWLPFEESAEELIRKYLERGLEPPQGFTPQVLIGYELYWIEKKVIEGIAKYNTQVVFIDQLDFIVPFGGDNHALRVGEAMRALKQVAKKWNVVIFLICHLSKVKMDIEPTLEDLKGSTSIGQEADTVIILWREMKRLSGHVEITNNTNVSIQANRRTGKTGNVKMVYENGFYTEKEWNSERERETLLDQEFTDFS